MSAGGVTHDVEPHRVVVGDVMLGAVAQCMAGDLADVVYSDPPWGEGNLRYWRTHAGDATRPSWDAFVAAWTRAVADATKPGAPVFVEMGLQWADEFAAALERVGIVVSRRWTGQSRSGARLLPNALLYAGAPLRADFDPSSLNARELPRACVAEVGDFRRVVLDPCCGKGFTARAAVAAGMIFRGVELNPKRAEVTVKWLRKNRW
jgi:hypothetical protein